MLRDYTIEYFRGLDQSQNENRLDPGMTADAANMITENGNLTVGYGFRHTFDPLLYQESRVPTEVNGNPVGDIYRMYYWHTLGADKFVVCAGDYIFAWNGSKWVPIMDYAASGLLNNIRIDTELDVVFSREKYRSASTVGTRTFTYDTEWKLDGVSADPRTYGIIVKDEPKNGDTIKVTWEQFHITSRKWDFVECRIGNKDYLLISNGQTQLVKWDGTTAANAAEVFGTGDFVYDGTITAVEYNATKALMTTYKETVSTLNATSTNAANAVYAVSDGVGTVTLTMPAGWSYSAGTAITFQVPAELGNVQTIKIAVGGGTYTLATLPAWDAGETVTVTLDTSTSASESNGSSITRTGTFTLIMPEGWTYTDGCMVAFDIQSEMNTLNKCRVKIADTVYDMTFIPIWAPGETALVSLSGNAVAVNTQVTFLTKGTITYASNVATIPLTDLPDNWAYSDDAWVGFVMNENLSGSTTKVKLKIDSVDYELNEVPGWTSGDLVLARLNTVFKSVGTSATAADSYAYSVDNYVGEYELTMPAAWSYSYGCIVSMTLQPGQVHETVSKLSVTIDGIEYGIADIPEWNEGDRVFVKLGRGKQAQPAEAETKYGVQAVSVTPAVTDAQRKRCLDIGLYVDYITSDVKEIDNAGTKITFKEVISRDDKPVLGDVVLIRGGVSDIPVAYMDLYYNRLLSAGDPEHPSRLYWSQPPGDTRSIEDWSMDDASEMTGGGHTEVGNTSSDPIVALVALSNQLLIFKEASVWRLIGDRPSNYQITRVNKDMEATSNSAIIANGDVPYWLTGAGMYYHDGQSAHLSPVARQIQKLLETVDLTNCKSCENRDRLYFSCRAGTGTEDDTLIVYDMKDRVHLIRNGFNITDICAYGGVIYMINQDRYVYQWDRNAHSYAGYEDGRIVEKEIEAYWSTPYTDLQARTVVKQVKWLYLRGNGDEVRIDIKAGPYVQHERYAMPADPGNIVRIPLRYEGRAIGLKIYNVAGGWFEVEGGLTLRYESKEDGT